MIDLLNNNKIENPVTEKRKRGRPKKVVEIQPVKDIQISVKKEPIKINTDNYNIFYPISLNKLLPIIIDDVIIIRDNDNSNRPVINMPENFNKVSFKNWMLNKGGIFYHDVFDNYKYNTEYQYGILENNEEKVLIRFITTESDIEYYKAANFIEGELNNKLFVSIRKFDIDENINSINRKKNTIDLLIDSEEDILIEEETDITLEIEETEDEYIDYIDYNDDYSQEYSNEYDILDELCENE